MIRRIGMMRRRFRVIGKMVERGWRVDDGLMTAWEYWDDKVPPCALGGKQDVLRLAVEDVRGWNGWIIY